MYLKEEFTELDISKLGGLLNILNCIRNGLGTGISNEHECSSKRFHHHLIRFIILDRQISTP